MVYYKRILFFISILCFYFSAFSQVPGWYYNVAAGKGGDELKTALKDIINPHTVISYDNVWIAYKFTDVNAEGFIEDLYTDCDFLYGENQCSQTSGTICVCYNREHAFCQSWFKVTGIDHTKTPMYSDIFHLYPTDGKVNSTRNNNPYGETGQNGTLVGSGKIGNSSISTPGYSGKVFEPADEYKGDIARTYFYFLTCYSDFVSQWANCPIIIDGKPAQWAIDMLLRWSIADPVSQKEIDRNNAAFNIQFNRNPYIDYPELAEKVFGSDKTPFMIDKSAELITIFDENCGTPQQTISLKENNWRNSPKIKYYGTADVRNTKPSSGYANVSGDGNIWLTYGGKYFTVDAINTSGYSDIFLTFGLRREQKEGVTADMLKIEISTDGEIWNELSITGGFPLSSGWSKVICGGNIPSVKKLKVRFTNKAQNTYQFRVDDIKIQGYVTSQTPSPTVYFYGEEADEPGSFWASAFAEISCNNANAVIKYSYADQAPSEIYTTPVNVSASGKINASAKADGLTESEIFSENINIKQPYKASLPYENNFSAGLQNFIQYSLSDESKVWSTDIQGGKSCAFINGYYQYGGSSNEDWLISPEFNLNDDTQLKTMQFYSYTYGTGSTLELLYSTNYKGYGNPDEALWLPLEAVFASGSQWMDSGELEFDDIDGEKIRFAFKYSSSGAAGLGSLWAITDIKIGGFKLIPPVAVVASGITESAFTANWKSVNEADSYLLNVLQNDNMILTDLTVSGISYQVTGLTPNTTYTYFLKSVSDNSISEKSNIISVTTLFKTGIEIITDENPLVFYTNGRLIINNDGVKELMIYDISGKLLQQLHIGQIQKPNPDISLKKGIYIIKAITTEKMYSYKIIAD